MKRAIRVLSLLLVFVTILSMIPATVSAADGPYISVTKYPTSIPYGKAFGLRGSITSSSKITRVDAGILTRDRDYRKDGIVVMSTVDYPNATSMNIQYAQVNNGLLFNKLKVGNYRLVIVATNSSGQTSRWEMPFTVYGDNSLSINMTRVPETHSFGSNFGLRGTVSSNYPITEVKGMVLHASCGCTVMETLDQPNTKSFNVRYGNINNYLEFNRLGHGFYILRVIATDSSGQTISCDYHFRVR